MSDKLTDEQAEEMLARLSEHFREPVMPMTRYCAAFERWMQCIHDAQKDVRPGEARHGASYAGNLRHIWTDIKKSSLLGRLLYGGEKFRTRKCPKHDGRWSGLSECEHGCDSTGWLPEAADPPA